jgi:hypothetical protein
MKIILISGHAENGKDELAKYLKEQLEQQGKKVIVDRFAKYIKGYLKDYYGWDGVTKDEFTRSKLQWLGTERIREELNHKIFHVERLAVDFSIVQDDFDFAIVADTRFPNEIYHMKAMFPKDTISVRVVRLGYKSKLTEEQLNHTSETSLDDFSFDILSYFV